MSAYATVRSLLFSLVERAYWGLQDNMQQCPLGFMSSKKEGAPSGDPSALAESAVSKEQGAVAVRSHPEVPYTAQRIVIPSSVAASFEIGDVYVGTRRQDGFQRWRPASEFSETAAPRPLLLDRASIGEIITIEIRNITDTPAAFMAAMIGHAHVRPKLRSRESAVGFGTTDVSLLRAVARALSGGDDLDEVIANRLHMAAFTVVERAFWGLHEAGELRELEIRQPSVGTTKRAVSVELVVDQAFKMERLIVDRDVARYFTLIDLKVGNCSQLNDSTGLPMAVFSAGDVGLRIDRAHPRQTIATVIKNSTEEPRDFVAKLVGRSLRRPGERTVSVSPVDAAAE